MLEQTTNERSEKLPIDLNLLNFIIKSYMLHRKRQKLVCFFCLKLKKLLNNTPPNVGGLEPAINSVCGQVIEWMAS